MKLLKVFWTPCDPACGRR